MKPLLLRDAVAEDAAPLAALIQNAFAEYAGQLDPPSSAHRKTAEIVGEELADGGALIAERDGALIGCVFFHPQADHVYIDRLAVLPPFRRQGIGRRLLAAVEERARELGYTRLRLSVRLALTANRAYYERLGYRLHSLGAHPGYPEPTFVKLEKALEGPAPNHIQI